jgi:POT family proton-dependent oligopeptide transporter
MGVNAGAFLGIMLCGYIGEKISWVGDLDLGNLYVFWNVTVLFYSRYFGSIGLKPSAESKRSL